MPSAGSVEVEHGGQTYRAPYAVKGGDVHILTPLGNKAPRGLENSQPQTVAEHMLREILHDRERGKPSR